MKENKLRKRVQLFCEAETRTKQSFKDSCDINNIVARFTRNTGVDYSKATGYPVDGMFDDFSDVADLRTMYERLATAEASFMTLPAKIRKRFANDPLDFMEFAMNPSNRDELIALGLINKPVEDVSSVRTPEGAEEA